mmetsp:Transcript_62509/g.116204  ORF Transcript_62509/g.116204 Transcript_62509/m.116204 type:complete len:284 (-) Transcript_62509:212-1063(-)
MVRTPKTAEDVGCDSKYGLVLDIWIILNGVANNVVHVVTPLPPRERNALADIAKSRAPPVVILPAVAYRIVSYVMTNEGRLLPEEGKEEGADEVLCDTWTHYCKVQCTKQKCQIPHDLVEIVRWPSLKHTPPQQLLANLSVLLHKLGHLVVFNVANVVDWQQLLVDAGRVIVCKGISDIFPSEVHYWKPATRVGVHILRHIVGLALDAQPRIFTSVVLGDLCHGDALLGFLSHCCRRWMNLRHEHRLAFLLAPNELLSICIFSYCCCSSNSGSTIGPIVFVAI